MPKRHFIDLNIQMLFIFRLGYFVSVPVSVAFCKMDLIVVLYIFIASMEFDSAQNTTASLVGDF